MAVNLIKCVDKANEVIQRFNPNSLSPFPYENIQTEYTNLKIKIGETPSGVSGVIVYYPENNEFVILINGKEAKTRQHFTIAHELGHFFLHEDYLKENRILVDDETSNIGNNRSLFRGENSIFSNIDLEREANNFAANLIMPEDLVIKAWNALKDIQGCAKIFNVSPSAMSIRLEKLGLLKVF